jgi:hypothetical protein
MMDRILYNSRRERLNKSVDLVNLINNYSSTVLSDRKLFIYKQNIRKFNRQTDGMLIAINIKMKFIHQDFPFSDLIKFLVIFSLV